MESTWRRTADILRRGSGQGGYREAGACPPHPIDWGTVPQGLPLAERALLAAYQLGPCQWQPKTAHLWQLNTAHLRGRRGSGSDGVRATGTARGDHAGVASRGSSEPDRSRSWCSRIR